MLDDLLTELTNQQQPQPPYTVITYPEKNYTVIYLYGEVKEPESAVNIIEALESAEAGHQIVFKINSPGGYMSTAIAIIEAMQQSMAYITVHVAGAAYSAASAIALQGDELWISDDSDFMIHSVSYGSYGKTHEVSSHTNFSQKIHKKFIKRAYKHFLTKKEIQRVIDGKDIYLNAKEVRKRWQKLVEWRDMKAKEAELAEIEEQLNQIQETVTELQQRHTELEEALKKTLG